MQIKSTKSFDSIKLILLFTFTTVIINFLPVIYKQIWYVILLLLIGYSKNIVFWLVFFFFILNYPLNLYYGKALDFIPITSSAWISIKPIIALLIFFKALSIKGQFYMPYRKEFKLLLAYIIVLIAVGFIYGYGTKSIYNTFLFITGITLFYTTFKIINKYDTLIQFVKIAYPIIFFVLGIQMFELITSVAISERLTSESNLFNSINETEGPIRLVYIAWFNFFCFSSSILLLTIRQKELSYTYLIMVVIASYLSIFLSATRGWIISYTFIAILFFILRGSSIYKRLYIIAFSFIFIFILNSIPPIKEQFKMVNDRMSTVKNITKGIVLNEDFTYEQTDERRTTERYPKAIKAFKESNLLFGYGYSEKNYEYYDGHVSYASILINSGILGLGLIIFFWIRIIYYNAKLLKWLPKGSNYKNMPIVFIILLGGLIIIHSTSSTHFSFNLDFQIIFNLALFLAMNAIMAKIAIVNNTKRKH